MRSKHQLRQMRLCPFHPICASGWKGQRFIWPLGFAWGTYLYVCVGIRENGEKIDYIVPLAGQSEEVFKEAFPNYDEYNGTAYIFRTGLGRKTKFVPQFTDFLGQYPHE
ncbi:MAG: hypothetical protein Q4C09_05015 [Atopobiaceae bacterium]|nr:hypothetical protein [Atopobiaceae bacterium]